MSMGRHFNQLILPNMQFLYRENGKHPDYQFAVDNDILGGKGVSTFLPIYSASNLL